MWNTNCLPIALLLTLTSASIPNSHVPTLPFLDAFTDPDFPVENATLPHLDLLKRQTNCPSGSNSCRWLNSNSNLCCRGSAVCSADIAGHIACCPQGASCTGTIAGVATATVTGTPGAGGVVLATPTAGGSTLTVSQPGTMTSNGIVVVTGTGAAVSSANAISYVSNPYFPFPYIPTTYANAAACSSAYSSCQGDARSCTAYLGGGNGMGVTISVSGGQGTTAAGPTTTYAAAFASSMCSSLSESACYKLTVEACGNFGSGTATVVGDAARCTGVPYGVGAGVGLAIGAMAFR